MKTYYFADEVSYHQPFSILDEQRREVFRAEGHFFSGDILLYSADGDELLRIKENRWTVLDHYRFYIGGEEVFALKDKAFFGGFEYVLEGLPWRIDGDVWGKDYSIYEETKELAAVKLKYRLDASAPSYYKIDVYEEEDTAFIMAIMLILDLILVRVERG